MQTASLQVISRSARAGLQFPVGRIHRFLKQRTTSHGRVGATAAVYRYENCQNKFWKKWRKVKEKPQIVYDLKER